MSERTKRDSIERRGPNSWRISVGVGTDPETGRYVRKREMVTGTKTQARARLEGLRVEVRHGNVTLDGNECVGKYLERWIKHREHIGKVRPRTAVVYRGYVVR